MEVRSRRRLQAEATRSDILASARRLFAGHGFAATSVADIARDAGVAVPTVYKSAGSKQAILHALVDAIDEEAGVHDARAAVQAAGDAASILHAAVRLTRQLNERCGDVVAGLASAAAADADARATLAEGERRHRAGMEMIAARLAAAGGLRDGVAPADAAVALAVLTSRHVYAELTGEYGWSFDRAEEWIEQSLAERLFPQGVD